MFLKRKVEQMAKSDAARRAGRKWNQENARVASCILKKEEYEKFKAVAENGGKTVSAALREYIRYCASAGTLPALSNIPERPSGDGFVE